MTDTSKPEQDEQKEEWPNVILTRDELDSALEAGLKSGESELTGREIVDRALARVRDGLKSAESERSIDEIIENAIAKVKIGCLKCLTNLTSFRGSVAEPRIQRREFSTLDSGSVFHASLNDD